MGETAKRAATAAVLVPAVLAAIYLDSTHYGVIVFAVVFGCGAQDEYLRMALGVGKGDDNGLVLRIVAGLLGAAIITLPSVYSPALVLPPLLTGSVIAIGFAVLFRKAQLADGGRHFGIALAGLLYVPLLMSVLPLFKKAGQIDWITVILCMAFFSDTLAYFVGRAIGKHKLYPAVSPGKSIEGSFGGIAGSCIAAVGVGSLWLIPSMPIWHAVILGVVASACGQMGDLVESLLKRTFGVKDSSRILPGHGGMLDRIDALLFVAPVAFYYVTLIA